jgi:chemotaxis protein MotB
MARKKKHEEHVNHERWLVSYADFVTLLFAFFVVMFAVSQVDSKKVGRFTESFRGAVEWDIMPGNGRGVLEGESRPEQKGPKGANNPSGVGKGGTQFSPFESEKKMLREGIAKKLGKDVLNGMKIEDVRGELVMRLPEQMMFSSGDATLNPEGKRVLDTLAELLQGRGLRMRIEGHTDSRPIRTARFPSNWELSTARATACVAYLVEANKYEASKLAAAGYGEFHPVASNDTAEGRAQNRRVDVVLARDIEDVATPFPPNVDWSQVPQAVAPGDERSANGPPPPSPRAAAPELERANDMKKSMDAMFAEPKGHAH